MTTMISEVYSAFRTAGVPEQDARKAAEALSSENLATKNDITEVKQDITEVKQDITEVKRDIIEVNRDIIEVKQEITELKQELTNNITEVDQRLTGNITEVRNDIAQLQREMAVVKWMLGIVIAAQVLPLLKAIAVI